jgi:hypothetical protein
MRGFKSGTRFKAGFGNPLLALWVWGDSINKSLTVAILGIQQKQFRMILNPILYNIDPV